MVPISSDISPQIAGTIAALIAPKVLPTVPGDRGRIAWARPATCPDRRGGRGSPSQKSPAAISPRSPDDLGPAQVASYMDAAWGDGCPPEANDSSETICAPNYAMMLPFCTTICTLFISTFCQTFALV